MEGIAGTATHTRFKTDPGAHRSVVLRDVSRAKVACSSCNVRELCVPGGLGHDMTLLLDRVVTNGIALRKGDTLFRIGGRFNGLYAIRTGSCKTVMLAEDGSEQVSGFQMSGDILGTDGIVASSHDCQAIALEDTQVCVLPFERAEELARENAEFQHGLHRLLSREIGRERGMMLMLGSMHADQRLAAFLLDLSARYQARGYSPSEFILRMTREDIGSYMGLKLETVSRLFSRFHSEGMLHVAGRVIKLLDRLALKRLMQVSA